MPRAHLAHNRCKTNGNSRFVENAQIEVPSWGGRGGGLRPFHPHTTLSQTPSEVGPRRIEGFAHSAAAEGGTAQKHASHGNHGRQCKRGTNAAVARVLFMPVCKMCSRFEPRQHFEVACCSGIANVVVARVSLILTVPRREKQGLPIYAAFDSCARLSREIHKTQ